MLSAMSVSKSTSIIFASLGSINGAISLFKRCSISFEKAGGTLIGR